MRVIAISALLLAACVVACQISAQSGSIDEPLTSQDRSRLRGDRAETIAFDERLAELGSKFGKELNSAINEDHSHNEHAVRIVQEIEMDFAVRLIRLDLLRMHRKLQSIASACRDHNERQRSTGCVIRFKAC